MQVQILRVNATMTETTAVKRVVAAAMALCKAGKGFCYNDERKISDPKIGQRLERACMDLKRARNAK